MTLLGLSGSLRQGSYNTALLRAAAEQMPDGWTLDLATPAGIPLYDADAEREQGLPDAVEALQQRIASADALLIATPEYNGAMPGVLKNTIDWCSRPSKDLGRVFKDKPAGLIGATPGGGATRLAQASWLPVCRALGLQLWNGRQLNVMRAATAFDADGRLIDDALQTRLTAYLEGFTDYLTRVHG